MCYMYTQYYEKYGYKRYCTIMCYILPNCKKVIKFNENKLTNIILFVKQYLWNKIYDKEEILLELNKMIKDFFASNIRIYVYCYNFYIKNSKYEKFLF